MFNLFGVEGALLYLSYVIAEDEKPLCLQIIKTLTDCALKSKTDFPHLKGITGVQTSIVNTLSPKIKIMA